MYAQMETYSLITSMNMSSVQVCNATLRVFPLTLTIRSSHSGGSVLLLVKFLFTNCLFSEILINCTFITRLHFCIFSINRMTLFNNTSPYCSMPNLDISYYSGFHIIVCGLWSDLRLQLLVADSLTFYRSRDNRDTNIIFGYN